MTSNAAGILELLDWKRRVFDLYRDVRAASDPRTAWALWRGERDKLFASHPQSPVPEGKTPSLTYYDYDHSARALADIEDTPRERYDIPASGGGNPMTFSRFGFARASLGDRTIELELYWLEGYGGGLFLPFKDATAGDETYGAGRYLLDTIKGADLGTVDGRLVLDFNFSYQPSCSYDSRWVCPLAPPPNHLTLPIPAGERLA
jgi:uncharacterized protein (DUF1684 family)